MLSQMLGHVMNRHSRDGVGLQQRRPVSRQGTTKSPESGPRLCGCPVQATGTQSSGGERTGILINSAGTASSLCEGKRETVLPPNSTLKNQLLLDYALGHKRRSI